MPLVHVQEPARDSTGDHADVDAGAAQLSPGAEAVPDDFGRNRGAGLLYAPCRWCVSTRFG